MVATGWYILYGNSAVGTLVPWLCESWFELYLCQGTYSRHLTPTLNCVTKGTLSV